MEFVDLNGTLLQVGGPPVHFTLIFILHSSFVTLIFLSVISRHLLAPNILLTTKYVYRNIIFCKYIYWRGNCVSTLTLNPNYDFTPTFFDFAFLPLCFEMKRRSTPTPSTAPNAIKEDNFALVNIPLLFLELCEYTFVCHYISAAFQ